jgi:hypothetical protein
LSWDGGDRFEYFEAAGAPTRRSPMWATKPLCLRWPGASLGSMLDASRAAVALNPALRRWHRARALDAALDATALLAMLRGRRVVQPRMGERRRVLALTVLREENEPTWRRAERELRRGPHDVSVEVSAVEGAGKFANLNRLLDATTPDQFDWLLVIDDDVVLPSRFLEVFLIAAEHFGLRIVQPAHCLVSHASWDVTRRSPFAIARTTNFVEIGPVTALHRHAIQALTPFPTDGMGYGLDFEWAGTARKHSWPIGVVDATPIVHLLPAGSTYSMSDAAVARGNDVYERPHTTVTFRRWD